MSVLNKPRAGDNRARIENEKKKKEERKKKIDKLGRCFGISNRRCLFTFPEPRIESFNPVIKCSRRKKSRNVSRGSNSWQLTAPKKHPARSGEFAISCSSEVLPQRFSPRSSRSPLSINTFLVCFPALDPRFLPPGEWPSRCRYELNFRIIPTEKRTKKFPEYEYLAFHPPSPNRFG